jgi:hypothetical protein
MALAQRRCFKLQRSGCLPRPGSLLGPYAQAPTASPACANNGSTAYKRVAEGLVKITQETAEEWRRVTFALCHQIVRTLMPLVHETVPSDVTASSRCKLAGRLQGRTSRSPSASPPGEGDSDEDIMVRSMADASALGNESAPASRVL